jgi:hypothetical protein
MHIIFTALAACMFCQCQTQTQAGVVEAEGMVRFNEIVGGWWRGLQSTNQKKGLVQAITAGNEQNNCSNAMYSSTLSLI